MESRTSNLNVAAAKGSIDSDSISFQSSDQAMINSTQGESTTANCSELASLPQRTNVICSSEVATVEQAVLNSDIDCTLNGVMLPELSAEALRPNDCTLVKAASSKPSEAVKFGVKLPERWFLLCWMAIVILHTACGVFLLYAGNLNSFLTSTKKLQLAGLATGKLSSYFNSSQIMCRFLAALHLGRTASIFAFSIKERDFVFLLKPRPAQRNNSRTDSLWKQRRESFTTMTQTASSLLKRHNLIGENSFAKVFTLQEVVVIISQTYQAYRCCSLVSETWLNGLYVAMVVANCWGIPLLCFLVRNHSPATVQSVLQTTNALLNMGSCFIFPFVMFWPYYLEFDMATLTFPIRYRYDSVWTSQAVMKLTMILALSNLDLLSKFVNHLSVFTSLIGLTSLLMQRPRPASSSVGDSSVKESVPEKKSIQKNKPSRLENVLHIIFILWAIALLGVYGHAEHQSQAFLGCKSRTHPWFSSGYPCSVFEFNCYQQQMDSPTDAIFRKMNPKTIQYVMITHCPSLRVPSAIQTFPAMLGFTVFNCTIVDWPSTSAITATKHKVLTAVVIGRANMSTFPEGLLEPLPTSLAVVSFAVTNLRTLPNNLYQRWKSISAFMVLDSQLEELPADIFQLQAVAFFFSGNRIQRLPSLDSVQRVIYLIDITKNPLQELPATISPYAYIGFLDAEYTNISSVPRWFSTNAKQGAAAGSPYCALPVASQNATNVICFPIDQTTIGKLNMTALDASFPVVKT